MADLQTIVQRMIDAGEPEENIASVIREYKPAAPEAQTTGIPTAAVFAAREGAPALATGAARFAANHPAAAQKIIGAGVSTLAGGAGGAIGGVPGAVVGASIRGVTPAQATIRQVAGQMAGETPAVATNAARALGIQNYAKELAGMKIDPADIIPKPNAANAVEGYANSLEKGILRLYGPSGEVVSGPSAVSRIPTAGAPGRLMTSARIAGKVLAPLQLAAGATDLAQAVEPTRRDIGVMGIGSSVPRSDEERAAHPALLNEAADRTRQALLWLLGRGQD